MPLKRYLLNFGYIGTYFRGVQKQHCKGIPVKPAETVQGLLEICLTKLRNRPINNPSVVPSSRTDSGVHALCSSAHVDLDFSSSNVSTEQITAGLNFVLKKAGFTNLFVYNTRQVPNTFNARFSAVKRTYIYRFAVLKKTFNTSLFNKVSSIPIPILEQDRCCFLNNPDIDLDLISRACPKFIGVKDFRTFMGSFREPSHLSTERTILSFKLNPGQPLYRCPLSDNYDFFEFEVVGKSFLYRQVRRMVGSLFSVGLKKLSLPDIDYMLNYPCKDNWNESAGVPPGYGLYLSSVKYDESDMILTDDNQIVKVSETLAEEEIGFDVHEKELAFKNGC